MATSHKGISHRPSDLAVVRSQIRSGRRLGHRYVALLGLRTYEWPDLIKQVRGGLRYSAFVRFQRNTNLPAKTVARLTQIPARTLARRRQLGKLGPEESERLLRASRVFGRALELFEGDPEATRDWLWSRQPALGGSAPLEVAESELGAKEVENLIGRLEHGIPS